MDMDRVRPPSLDKHILRSQWPDYDEDQMRHTLEAVIAETLAQRPPWRRAAAAVSRVLLDSRRHRIPARYRAARTRRLLLERADQLLEPPTRELLAMALDGKPLSALALHSDSDPGGVRRALLRARRMLTTARTTTTTT